MRTDALHNRRRVLDAARTLFAEKGVEVTMREVARRAGIGPATLYRRFPTKQSLVDEAFAAELRACRQIVADGCADPDPWRGFCSIVDRICVLNAGNQGFVEAFTSGDEHGAIIAEHRASLLRQLAVLARRSKAAGQLRHDFVIDDLVLVLSACRGLSSVDADVRVASARRFAALALDAFRASADNAALPRGPRLLTRRLVDRGSRVGQAAPGEVITT